MRENCESWWKVWHRKFSSFTTPCAALTEAVIFGWLCMPFIAQRSQAYHWSICSCQSSYLHLRFTLKSITLRNYSQKYYDSYFMIPSILYLIAFCALLRHFVIFVSLLSVVCCQPWLCAVALQCFCLWPWLGRRGEHQNIQRPQPTSPSKGGVLGIPWHPFKMTLL